MNEEYNYRIGERPNKKGLYLISESRSGCNKREYTYRDYEYLKILVERFERLRVFTTRYRLLKQAKEMIEKRIKDEVKIEE